MYESLLNCPDDFFRNIGRWRGDFDDLFGFAGLPSSIRSVAPGTYPAINIGNTAESVEIYAFAPGIDASKVDVTIDRGVLSLSGERASTTPDDDDKTSVHSRERFSGKFQRAVSLPDDVDADKVSASYRDGILRISVPRRKSVLPKRIAIQ